MLIISLNIRGGINSKDKPYKIIDYLKDIPFDIALLQEVSSIKPKNKELIERELNVDIYLKGNLKQKHHIGVVAFIKKETCIQIDNITYPNMIGEGRAQHLKIQTQGFKINLINIYASTHLSDKRTQWSALNKYIKNLENIIIMGDFNSTIDKNERMGNIENYRIDNLLTDIIKQNDLTDIASFTDDKTHTYIGYKATSLIDRILMKENLKQHFIQYQNKICPHSDHNMITLNMFNQREIVDKKIFRVWKLNNSLLDRETKDKLAHFWEEWRYSLENYSTTMEWYLTGKEKVRKMLIKIGKQRAKDRHNEENKLNNFMESEMKRQIPNLELIKQCKKKLEKIINYKIEGMKIRTRTQTLPNEEKGSKAFFNIENKKKKQMNIKTLLGQNGKILISENDINNEIHNFYKTLYTSEHVSETAINRLIDEYKPTEQLTEHEIKELNSPFTLKEIEKVLNKMNNNKSPGPDGLTKEYYIAMWEHIKYDILSFAQGIDLHNSLPTDLTTGIIKLLYKKNDARLLKNWRPISLLNVDFKIITSLVASRLSKILNKLINPSQSCSVKNRYIFENLITIEQILQLYEFSHDKYKHLDGSIIKCLDMEKAFDRVEHKYLFRLIDKLQLGNNISNKIKLLYQNIHQIVETPHGYTEQIHLSRGIRQGCALSMCLFTLTLEPLLQKINSTLTGFELNRNNNIKTLAYADDTVVFLRDTHDSEKLNLILKVYEKASGAKINSEKSQDLKLKNGDSGEIIEVLGIKFTLANKDRTNINWDNCIKKIKSKIIPFQQRNVTILGKATLINAYIISLIIYTARIIPPYKKHIKQINSILQNFIKTEKPIGYSMQDVQRHPSEGGFGIPNVQNKVLAASYMWLHYLVNKTETNYWTDIFRQQLRTTPKKEQNSIQHNILMFKNKERIDWKTVTMSKLYKMKMAETQHKYPIERSLANTFDWGKIWEGWYRLNMNNKIKVQAHRVISETIASQKVINRSGNCCLCDFPYIQSRDHIFVNCQGAKRLIRYIKEVEKIEIGSNIFYDKYTSLLQLKVSYIYMYTIIKLRESHIDKWGTIGELMALNCYDTNKKWLE